MRHNVRMKKPFAFVNGRFLSASDVAVPLNDTGLVLGAAVTEQLRTFSGRLFHLDDHLKRLGRSLDIVGIDPGLGRGQLANAAERLSGFNLSEIRQRDDLGLCIFVTPGPYPTLSDGRAGDPLVCMHTYPLPFKLWAEKYESGASLVTTDVQQVSPSSWPPALKCRSRMHYYLADRAAALKEPGSRALLLDADGHVLEASTANVVLYYEAEGLVAPPHEKVLPGISLAVLYELAESLGIPHQERELTPDDVARADEVLLTSTPFCLMPVTRFNGQPVTTGQPGHVFRKLIAAWSEKVGFDIAEQAVRFAARNHSA
jgi:branched-subunit amino acid aminotransferase/4-amino-4-deoxychorismate lyase